MLIRDIISALSEHIDIVVLCKDKVVLKGKKDVLESSVWCEASLILVTARGNKLILVV